MVRESKSLEISLIVAPLAAVLVMLATWTHYFWSGGLALQVWPRTSNVVVPAAVAGLFIVVLGACCVLAFQRASTADLSRLWRAALLVHIALLPSLPLTSTDLFSYLAYGELGANGLDMKQVGPAALQGSAFLNIAQWQNTPSVYGPVADGLMLVAGVIGGWLGSPVWGAGLVYKLIVGACDVGSIALLFHLVRRAPTPAGVRGFALFALNPLLAWEVASQGHNDGFLVFGGCAYVVAVGFGREILGVAALTLGTLAKFLLAPPLALHLWITARTSFKRSLSAAAVALALVVLFCLPRWAPGAKLSDWLPQLRPGLFDPHQSATSLCSVVTRLWAAVVSSSDADRVMLHKFFTWAGRVVVAGLALMIVPRMRSVQDVPRASFLILLAIVGTATTLAPWYLTWLLPFAAVLTEHRWQVIALSITVVAAPSLCVPGLWMTLPLAQIVALLALSGWGWKASRVADPALESA